MAPTICDIILNDETEPLPVVLQEPVNLPVLKKLLFHPMLTQEQRWSLQSYDSIVQDGYASITYTPSLHGLGRLYAKNGLSLQFFKKDIRSVLAQGLLHDLDMVNAHPSILLQLCDEMKIDCPNLRHYVEQRKDCLDDVIKAFSVSYASAKQLFLCLLYGGTITKWLENVGQGKVATPKFLSEFEEELEQIQDFLWNKFGRLQKFEQFLRTKKEQNKRLKSSFLSIILQILENRALIEMSKCISDAGYSVAVYIFDGLMVKRRNTTDTFPESLLRKCEQTILTKTGLRIKLEEKALETGINIAECNIFNLKMSELTDLYVTHEQKLAHYVSDMSEVLNDTKWKWKLIKSPTGTGKTTFLSHHFEHLEKQHQKTLKMISLSPRCSVTNQHLNTFKDIGFVHYTDPKWKTARRIICTLDSFLKIEDTEADPIEVLYIDEMESFLEHFFASTVRNRKLIWQKFLRACYNSRHIICTDADLGDLSTNFFKNVLSLFSKKTGASSKSKALLLENQLQPVTLDVHIAHTRNQWYQELEQCLKHPDSKIFIGCDSKKNGRALKGKIQKWATDNHVQHIAHHQILLYTSQDGDPKDFEDVHKAWGDAKVVICSPSVIYGLDYSSTTKPFSAVMGFYVNQGKTMGADKIRQQLRRIRHIHRPISQHWDVMLYCMINTFSEPETDPAVILSDLKDFCSNYEKSFNMKLKNEIFDIVSSTIHADGTIEIQEDAFLELYVQFLRKRNLSCGSLKDTICYLLSIEGHKITLLSSPKNPIENSFWNHESEYLSKMHKEDIDNFIDLYQKEYKNNNPSRRIESTLEILQSIMQIPALPDAAQVKQNEFLSNLLASDKALSGWLKFRKLCRSTVQSFDADTEFYQTFVTDEEHILLKILEKLEIDVLKVKRFDCIFLSEDKVRDMLNRPLDISKELMSLISSNDTLKHGFFKTEYDVYFAICKIYAKFCRGISDKGAPKRYITSKYPYIIKRVHTLGKKKSFDSKTSKVCSVCNKALSHNQFTKSRSDCHSCRKTFQFFALDRNWFSQSVELILRGKFNPCSFRIDEPIIRSFLSSQSKLHSLWNESPSSLCQLLQQKLPPEFHDEFISTPNTSQYIATETN